jgi:chromosome segregation ATPase
MIKWSIRLATQKGRAMAKKKDKDATPKKKIAALLAKMEKKQAQIERKSKQLKSLKDRAAKILAQNPELKPTTSNKPKSTASRKKAAPKNS